MSDIMVSICCTAFNHEKYIAEAVESFLMQQIRFKVEILIHDDASTDSTADIIRHYERLHPEMIKPIYQSENQYSKGIKVGKFNRERSIGKYIALCEGDDYWVDPLKLQKQVDYLEAHPECTMCVHGAYKVDQYNNRLKRSVRPHRGDKDFYADEVIRGGGGLFPTNSIVYRQALGHNRPLFMQLSPVGDYPLAIYMALQGYIFYMDEMMSAYRVGASGSWTNRMIHDEKKATVYYTRMEQMMDELNNYTKGSYESSIAWVKRQIYLKKNFPQVTRLLKIIRNRIG